MMHSFVVVVACEFLPTDSLRLLAAAAKGCRVVATGEYRRRQSGHAAQVASKLLEDGGLTNPALRAVATAFFVHQQETLPLRSTAGLVPVEIPGMSGFEASQAFDRVGVRFPEILADGQHIQWRRRQHDTVDDRSRGCVAGFGVSVGGAEPPFEFAAYGTYLQLHTGVFSATVFVKAPAATGSIDEVFWALRMGDQDFVLGPSADDAIASWPRAFGHLVTVRPCAEDPAGTTIEDVAAAAAADRECPTARTEELNLRRLFPTLRPSVADAVGSLQRLFAPARAAPDALSAILDERHFGPVGALLPEAPVAFTHSSQFKKLQTPKGTYLGATGLSDVGRVDLVEAWAHTRQRLQRYLARGWDRGLDALWREGMVPLGIIGCLAPHGPL
jgi:hypothetical protein